MNEYNIIAFEEFCDKLMIPAEEGLFTSLVEKSANISLGNFKMRKAESDDFDYLVKKGSILYGGIKGSIPCASNMSIFL